MTKRQLKEQVKPNFEHLFSDEAEQSVLGAILVRPNILDEVMDILSGPEDFYREAHKLIYRAMLQLDSKRNPVDLVTVCQYLKEQGLLDAAGGHVFISGLSEQCGFATNGPYYATVVQEKAALRRFREVLLEAVSACHVPVEDVAEFLNVGSSRIFEAAEFRRSGEGVKPMADLVSPEVDLLEKLHRQDKITGIHSGFYDLDRLTGGFQREDMITIAARPGMGKTGLGLTIAYNAAVTGTPALVFSLEMSKSQIIRRLLASLGNLDTLRMRDGKMTGNEWAKLFEIQGDLMDAPLYLDDSGYLTHLEIRTRARRAKVRFGIGLVVIDYLQLVRAPQARNREQEIAEISRSCKALAKELRVPVVVLAQINRACEIRENKRPLLSDLRESGAIEQDSDVVAFIYRDEYYNATTEENKDIAEILIRKQRNGPTGVIKLRFLQESVTFQNYLED